MLDVGCWILDAGGWKAGRKRIGEEGKGSAGWSPKGTGKTPWN